MNTTTLFNFMRRAAMVLLFAVTASATAQTGNNYLVSHYEQDFVGGIGCAYVSGWVYDSSLKHWEAGKEIQVFGVISTKREETDEGYERYIECDNVYYFVRNDINEAYGLSGNHGFRIAFDINAYVDWFNEEGASDGITLYVRVYATVNNGNGDEDIELFGPIAVPNVKSPLWEEPHVTQENNGIYTRFTPVEGYGYWKKLVDGDLNTYVSSNRQLHLRFYSDEDIIPTAIWFNTIPNALTPTSWKLYGKLHEGDSWTLLESKDWPSASWYNYGITPFEIPNEEYRRCRYFDFYAEPNGTINYFYLKELRIAGGCYKHLLPRLATCSQVGIMRECYYRGSDGKYFADDAATTEYAASLVEIPKKAHWGPPCEGAGCWQCWMCHNYFSDEACTIPYPTWSVTLPEQMEIIIDEGHEHDADSNGKYIQGTVIHFKAKELYEGYISNVKVGETELTPDQDGIYTLTMGDADAVVTAKVNLLVLANDADNADAIRALSGQQVLVRLKDRTLYKDGLWNSLCLPFNMSAQQVTEQLAPTRLMTLESASVENDKLTLYFADATEIQAGKPYIIRWTKSSDLLEPIFTQVTIPDYTTTDIDQVYFEARCQSDCVDFVGTYSPLKFTSEDKSILMFIIINLFGYDVTVLAYPKNTAIGSGRGYFMLKGIHFEKASQIKEFVLNTGEDDADGISLTPALSEGEGEWYDLSGRKLASKPTQKGIYIVNGKKILK